MTELSPSDDILTPAERKRLHERTIDSRIANEKYLRSHPEVTLVLSNVMKLLLIRRPDEPVPFLEDFLATVDLHALADKLKDEKAQHE
jgi:hypothetical protein